MLCCQSGHDEEPKRPRLYLGMDLLEFREEVVRGILDEMLEESGKEIKEIGLDHIRNEIEYDVTESIKGHLKIRRNGRQISRKKTEPSSCPLKLSKDSRDRTVSGTCK